MVVIHRGFPLDSIYLIVVRFLAIVFYLLFFPHSTNSIHAPTPATRAKGEVACYSCFSLGNMEPTTLISSWSSQSTTFIHSLQPGLWGNITDLVHIIEEAGMTVPPLVPRCADTSETSTNPNFSGAKVHVCPNRENEPGACVKLKGHLNGESFIYRDCWARMWKDTRPFHYRMSGKCFNDEMVQTFIETTDNSICFCEDDLCNLSVRGGDRETRNSVLFILALFLIILTG